MSSSLNFSIGLESIPKKLSDIDYSSAVYKIIAFKLEISGKRLVIFIDNYNDFIDKLSEQEQISFRELLSNSKYFKLIGGTSSYVESMFGSKHSMFGIFRVERLHPLTFTETYNLLVRVSELDDRPEVGKAISENSDRVKILLRLTGGVTRTIMLLYGIFVDEESFDAFKNLDKILDKVTALYKHRMDDLKPLEQQIVDIVALNWDAITVKEIINKSRIDEEELEKSLFILSKQGVFERIVAEESKTSYYRIRERFFNIWYLMRYSQNAGNKNKVVFLARFLQNWLNPRDLRDRIEKFISNYNDGLYLNTDSEVLLLLYKHPELKTPRFLLEELSKMTESKRNYAAISSNSEIKRYNISSKFDEFQDTRFKELLVRSLISLDSKVSIIKNYSNLTLKQLDILLEKFKSEYELLRGFEISLRDFNCDKEKVGYICMNILENIEIGLMYYEDSYTENNFDAYRLGQLFKDNELYGKAEKYFTIAYEDEGNYDALEQIANIYRSKYAALEEAKEFYKKHYESTGDVESLYVSANLSMQLNKHEEALSSFINYVNDYKLNSWNRKTDDSISSIAYLLSEKLNKPNSALEYLSQIKEKGYEYRDYDYQTEKIKLWHYDGGEESISRLLNLKTKSSSIYNTVAWYCYSNTIFKKTALYAAKEGYELFPSKHFLHTYACVMMWCNEVELANKGFVKFLNRIKESDSFDKDIIEYLMLGLAQSSDLDSIIEILRNESGKSNVKLKTQYAPIYFAALKISNSNDEELYRMPEVYSETVLEIINEVKKISKKYFG